MLLNFGSQKNKGAANGAQTPSQSPSQPLSQSPGVGMGAGNAAAAIFDVTAATFEDAVLKPSMTTPVLVDFWAPWCGPCKQLMPILESLVTAAAGKILLAKVNIDDNPELAQALRVQSVPTVYAFFQGQPVTAFAGMRPQSEIQALIDQLLKMSQQARPDAIDIPQALAEAAAALAGGDFLTAQDLYVSVLEQDEKNAQAFVGLVRTFIAAGKVDQAQGMLDNVPDELAKNPQLEAARVAVELARSAPAGDAQALAAKLALDPADQQARFDLALVLFHQGRKDEAIRHLIDAIRKDRTWEDEKARKQLLKFFDALGHADPAVVTGRRQLSALLFS